MLKGLQGKSVVVTGAAGGIGAAACRRLSEEGARVVAADIDADKAKEIAGSLSGDAVGVGADVTTTDGAQACVTAAVDAFGRLDLFFANAGVEGTARTVVDFDVADFEHVISVNVRGAFMCAQAALRRFNETG